MNAADWWEMLNRAGFHTMRSMLSVLWQSSILIAAAAVLAHALRRRRASVRHALWAAAVLTVPLLPLLGWAASGIGTPQAGIPVLPTYASRPVGPVAPLRPAGPAGPEAHTRPPPPQETVPAPPGPAVAAPLRQQESRLSVLSYPWALAFLAYASGAAGFLLLVLLGRARIRRWVRKGRCVTDPRLLETFQAARGWLGLAKGFIVVESQNVHTPMTIGAFHPVVVLPAGLAGNLTTAELQALAIHELAHVKRHDAVLLSLLSLVRALLFFHPLVWLGCRQAAGLAEGACDDAVLDATGEPVSYARILTRLVEELPRRALATELAAGIVLSKGAFLRRIEAILSDRRADIRKLPRWALAVTAIAAVVSVALAVALPLGEKSAGDAAPRQTPAGAPTQSAKESIPALIRALKDKDVSVRKEAAKALAALQPAPREAAAALIQAVKDERDSKEVQVQAVSALGRIGPAAVPQLLEALRAKDTRHVRRLLAWALGKTGPAAVPQLIGALRDEDGPVRWGAASALASIGPPAAKAIPTLIQVLKDEDAEVRRAAAGTLGTIGPAAREAVGALIPVLKDPDSDARISAAWALGHIGPAKEVLPALIPALKDKRWEVRWHTALVLGELGPAAEQALPELLEALDDKHGGVRANAAKALARVAPAAKAAARALAARALGEALKDKDASVRQAAVLALGRIGPAAVAQLIRALKQEDSIVRVRAAEALGELGPAAGAAAAALNEASKDKDEYAREAAAAALKRVRAPAHPGPPAGRSATTTRPATAGPDLEKELNLTPEQQAKVRQWLEKRKEPKLLNPQELVEFLKTILDEKQKAILNRVTGSPKGPEHRIVVPGAMEWGKAVDGLRCGLTAERADAQVRVRRGLLAEAGEVPMGAMVVFRIHLRFDPTAATGATGVDPKINILNRCDQAWRAALTFRDTKTGKVFRRSPFDVGMPPPGPGVGDMAPLRGKPLRPDRFDVYLLSEEGRQIPPGVYRVTATYENNAKPQVEAYVNPDGSVGARPYKGPWKFWKGKIESAPMVLKVTRAEVEEIELKTNSALAVRRTADGVGWSWSEKAPTKIRVKRRPGYIVGSKYEIHVFLGGKEVEYGGGGWGGGVWRDGGGRSYLPPRIAKRALAGEPLKLCADVEIFETSVPPRHMWGPKGGDYKVLWKGRVEGALGRAR